DRLALDVCDRRSAGAPRILSAPLRFGTGNGRGGAGQAGASRRSAIDMGDFFWPDLEDNDPGIVDGDGMPGRLLRDYILGAALPHNGAKALDRFFDRLPVGADHWIFCRLSRRCLACRSDRKTQSLPDLFG